MELMFYFKLENILELDLPKVGYILNVLSSSLDTFINNIAKTKKHIIFVKVELMFYLKLENILEIDLPKVGYIFNVLG